MNIENIIQEYVAKDLLFSDNGFEYSNDDSFLEEGIIEGQNLFMIGDRALLSTEEFAYLNDRKISLFSISDIWEKGMINIMQNVVSTLKTQVDGVYISIDIDVFDPCFAPGTGTPVPGGLSPKEMIQAINVICESLSLVGIDIVEVAPNYDPTENTQNLAAFLFYRFFQLYQGF